MPLIREKDTASTRFGFCVHYVPPDEMVPVANQAQVTLHLALNAAVSRSLKGKYIRGYRLIEETTLLAYQGRGLRSAITQKSGVRFLTAAVECRTSELKVSIASEREMRTS